MKCARCDLDLPAGLKQCPKCGNVNEFAEVPATPKTVKPVVYIAGGLVLLALLALVVAVIAGRGNRDLTAAPGPAPAPPGNVTSAPPGSPGPGQVTSAPAGVPAPPATAPPGVEKPKPSQELLNYLAFVKEVDKCRKAAIVDSKLPEQLLEDLSGVWQRAFSEAGNADASTEEIFNYDKIIDRMSRHAGYMLALLQTFDRYPAPPESREFAGAYRRLLFVETDTLYSFAAEMKRGADADWRKIRDATAGSQEQKAASSGELSDTANAALGRLTAEYDMQRPFEVAREQPSAGSIMSAPLGR